MLSTVLDDNKPSGQSIGYKAAQRTPVMALCWFVSFRLVAHDLWQSPRAVGLMTEEDGWNNDHVIGHLRGNPDLSLQGICGLLVHLQMVRYCCCSFPSLQPSLLPAHSFPSARLLPVHPGQVPPAWQPRAGCRLRLGLPDSCHGADGEQCLGWYKDGKIVRSGRTGWYSRDEMQCSAE